MSIQKPTTQKESQEEKNVPWIKRNKKKIILCCSALAGIVGGVVYCKSTSNSNKTLKLADGLLRNLNTSSIAEKTSEAISAAKIIIPNDFELSGNKLTARDLGHKVLCSAQDINKRIISAGLAKRLPCGEISLTEAGEKLGQMTSKTTKYGYTFSNIEWDESILPLIFSKDELAGIAEKWKKLKSA